MDGEKLGDLRLSEVIAALTYALDITDGQPLGHAVRSCLIGMRIAAELDLRVDERAALFYGLLLKDAGCSSNAAKVASLYGTDDHAAKANVKLINHSNVGEALGYIVRNAGGPTALVRILRAGKATAREMTAIRCERGAEIARMLDVPEQAAEAIYALDEHWDGKGHPLGLAGESIPLFARVLCLAQTTEVFFTRHGLAAALDVAHARSGRWFDPSLVEVLKSVAGDDRFWSQLGDEDVHAQVAAFEPPDLVRSADDASLDRVAEAFARVIDAKSPYTFAHSKGVATFAVAIGGELGFDDLGLRDLRRAGLLHDIGKLAISSRILDKPGKLTDAEFRTVQEHPVCSARILARVPAFSELSALASAHHERIDGSGYPDRLAGAELTLPMRALAVADVFEALTADRPYRGPLPTADALAIVRAERGTKLDADCVDALAAWVARHEPAVAAA